MKIKIIILIGLFIGFFLFLFFNFFILKKENEIGILNINSSPTSNVFINNVAVGKTPYEEKQKVGSYIIKLIPDKTATETASWSGKINVYKNSKTFVNFELGSSDVFTTGEIFTTEKILSGLSNKNYGEIYIETEPQGAIVSLNNDEKGTSPLILKDVFKGEHEISVFMTGFFKRTQRINVNGGYRVNAYFKLGLDSTQKKIEDIEKTTTQSGKTKDKIYVVINQNPQGWLRVRSDASINATEEAKVKVGEKFEFLEEKNGWYKIRFNGNRDSLISGEFDEGWISKEYASKE